MLFRSVTGRTEYDEEDTYVICSCATTDDARDVFRAEMRKRRGKLKDSEIEINTIAMSDSAIVEAEG